MATPQSSSSSDGGDDRNLEQITFRFCSECSNMLYPKEDQETHKLQFTCRTCQYTEEAASTCVFRNNLSVSAGETAGVTQDVGSDPTVSDAPCLCFACGSPIKCAHCALPAEFVAIFLPKPGVAVVAGDQEDPDMGDFFATAVAAAAADMSFGEYDEEPEQDQTTCTMGSPESNCLTVATSVEADPEALREPAAGQDGNVASVAANEAAAAAAAESRYRMLCSLLYGDMTMHM